MASHLQFSILKSPAHITKIYPWKSQAILIPHPRRTACALNAEGRGFGLARVSNNKQKRAEGNDDDEGKDEDDAIPEVVFNRMLVRILSFVGVPMASGVGMLYVLSTLKEKGIWESPVWLPFLTLLLSFGTSAFGIAYGILSTSWDIETAGSLLGWEEVRKNWPELWKEDENGER